jgi:hypothetical protein
MREIIYLKEKEEVDEFFKHKNRCVSSHYILFTSIWDSWCKKLTKFYDKWKAKEGNEKLVIITSFYTPEIFGSYSITSAPSLMKISDGMIKNVIVEYPTIYDFLNR